MGLPYAQYKHNSTSTNGKNVCIMKFGQNNVFIATSYEKNLHKTFFSRTSHMQKE